MMKQVIHYGDSLDWPWPKDDVDLIQQWLCAHGFSPFLKGVAIPHGLQENSFSCVIAIINIIRHHLFGIPLFIFTNKRKQLLRITELSYLLHAHFNEKDSFHDTPDTDPDCHTSPHTNTSWFSSPLMSDTSSQNFHASQARSPSPKSTSNPHLMKELKELKSADNLIQTSLTVDMSELQATQSLAELSRPHRQIKEALHQARKSSAS
ncbi:hypothetical protein PAXINDRAFT_18319 [Paxillus involutus ATCC 200175]|uniref:Uncharacterized protein n=1 Tax=Paxillus involutus ATCC 200175 TaxID=664439 RepID=A0A0C9SZ89_PAXIN|nr:hypothetical protein PAXINDRAFT_18319 [Paxillus involutus ATCC 200175]